MSTNIKPPDEQFVRAVGPVIALSKIQVPLLLALGQYEKLTDEELNDHYADIRAECARRDWDLSG